MIATASVSLEERLRIDELYSAYVACLDERRYDEWPDFFVDECSYRVVARENYDRGLPLATLSFESKGMLRDRVYGITQTLFHEPYYQRHLVTNFRIAAVPDGYAVQANYLIIRTKAGELSELFNTGRFIDKLVARDGHLLFKEKTAIFDSETIPNSLIYPI